MSKLVAISKEMEPIFHFWIFRVPLEALSIQLPIKLNFISPRVAPTFYVSFFCLQYFSPKETKGMLFGGKTRKIVERHVSTNGITSV